MREMKDSGIKWLGEIPLTWSVERVKHGFVRKKEEAHIENPVVLSLARAGVKERDISNNEGQLASSYYNYNRVSVGDLLINPMDLYSGANCGISNIEGVISPAYINLKNKEEYNPEYYDYYFKLQYWLMAFFAYGKGVSFENRWTLNSETLMNYPIVVPALDEQKRIASYLDEKCSKIDEIIDKQQILIEKLKEYKLSIITETVTKGLNSNAEMKGSGIEWLGKIPNHWEKRKLGDITDRIIVGLATSVTPYYRESGTILLRNLNIKEGYLDDKDLLYLDEDFSSSQSGKMIEKGDVLTVHTGSNLGMTCVVPERYEKTLSFTTLITSPQQDKLDSRFLMYTLNSALGKSEIEKLKCGDVKANLNVRQFKYFLVLLPPLNEQQDIVMILDKKCYELDKSVKTIEKEIELLKKHKKSLIYEVVTGKKEIK